MMAPLICSLFLLICYCRGNHITSPTSLRLNEGNLHYLKHDSRLNQYDKLYKIKGGVVVSGKKKKSPIKSAQEALNQIKPATRYYLLLTIFCTAVHLTGLPAPTLFNLDLSRWFEIWRPLTAMAYFGAPSMSMANSIYFLISFGQYLENELGTGSFAWFLIVQTVLLSLFGLLFGLPLPARAMIAAIVYANSRRDAMKPMPFQFGTTITTWQLPFCMMGIDCLSQQSAEAAWPHVLGILTGHIYHFFTVVWPALGGKAQLLPPKWIIKRLGDKPNSNVAGLDFRKKDTLGSKKSKSFPTSKKAKK